MFRFAPEGLPFILGSAVLTLVVLALTRNWSALVPAVLFMFMLYFFRDPDRSVPDGMDIFVAPADGRIIVIKEVDDPPLMKGRARQVSIFMSPFNVHVNRSPCNGRVVEVVHTRGGFSAAYKDSAARANENTVMVLATEYGTVAVRQVAGFIARRIVCRARPGDILSTGQRYGIIKFSSRVDLFLPLNTEITVSLDDRVRAGETVMAKVTE